MPIQEYRELSRCWNDAQGNFRALLIVASAGDRRVPYFVSTTCRVHSNGRDNTIIEHSNALFIEGDGGTLMNRGLLSHPLSPNYVTDLVPDLQSASIYAFYGRIALTPRGQTSHFNIYRIADARMVRHMPLSFLDFVDMPADQLRQMYEIQLTSGQLMSNQGNSARH